MEAHAQASAEHSILGRDWLPPFASIPWRLIWVSADAPSRLAQLPDNPIMRDHLLSVDGSLVTRADVERTRNDRGWCTAEILRVYGEKISLGNSAVAHGQAQTLFEESLELSGAHGAVAWELRAASSLARLWQGMGRKAAAVALLEPLYRRFTEGLETSDMKKASMLLEELSA